MLNSWEQKRDWWYWMIILIEHSISKSA